MEKLEFFTMRDGHVYVGQSNYNEAGEDKFVGDITQPLIARMEKAHDKGLNTGRKLGRAEALAEIRDALPKE